MSSVEERTVASSRPKVPVVLLDYTEADLPRVGGLSASERWRRVLADVEVELDFEVVQATPARLATVLATQKEPFILLDGRYVLDPLGAEAAIERGWERRGADVVLLTSRAGILPVAVLSPKAAAAWVRHPAWTGLKWPELMALFEAETGLTVHQEELGVECFFMALTTESESARAAEWGLLKRLQYRPGGLVAKYVNRPISIRLSRHLINTSITPNQTTLLAFALGAVGVALIATGGPIEAIFGALLLQLNSIVDGIDGELARVRHTKSEFGAFLDSICDEILNGLMYAAIGYHLSHTDYALLTGELLPRALYFPIGVFAGAVSFTYSLVHWHCKLKHKLGFYWWWEAYKPRKQVQRSTSFYTYFKKLFWKESTLFLLCFAAAFKWLNVYVLLGAIAAAPVAVLLVVHILILRKRW